MYTHPITPAEAAKTVANFLAALGLEFDEMELIASNRNAKGAARAALAAVVNPPAVCLLRQTVGKDRYRSQVELYAAAMKIDFNWLFSTSLSAEEREVVEYRFGFTTGRPQTLEETGAVFNRTRQWVKNTLTSAIEKLKLVL